MLTFRFDGSSADNFSCVEFSLVFLWCHSSRVAEEGPDPNIFRAPQNTDQTPHLIVFFGSKCKHTFSSMTKSPTVCFEL